MIRSLQPTDLWSLVQFARTPRANEARPREKLTRSCAEMLPPYTVFADWVPARGRRYVWVASDDRQVRGAASLRRRAGKDAWEIDTLLLDGGDGLCTELLERAGMTAGAQGVQRVFLRMDSESPLVSEAVRAGFVAYQRERLLQACASPTISAAPSIPAGLRLRADGDDYPLFRLFQAAVSSGVQAAEGATYKEWQATREKGWGRGRRSEFVYEGQGELLGWLRVTGASACGYLDMLVRPDEEAVAGVLVDFGCQRLAGKECMLSLVRETDTAVLRRLRERGFKEQDGYVTLVKHIAARVRAPCFIPAGA